MTFATQGHFAETGMHYAHGFLGAAAMEAYVELARHQLGLSVTLPALPPDPPQTFGSAWGGLGAQLMLSQLITGSVPDRLWQRFSLAVDETERVDFYQGVDGMPLVLAALVRAHPARVERLAYLTHQRLVQRLADAIDRHDREQPVNVGLAHGLAGTLIGYEIACALLQLDGTAHRQRAIAQLSASAVATPSGAIWPNLAHAESPRTHGLCNGGPSVCLAAVLGYRYSGDDAYVPLIQQAVETVPVHTQNESLCCGTLGRVEVLIETFRTSGDDTFLSLARGLFAKVDRARLVGRSWKEGAIAYQLTALRLSAPTEIDLPGLPMQIAPLEDADNAVMPAPLVR